MGGEVHFRMIGAAFIKKRPRQLPFKGTGPKARL